nr:RNA-directed DNA polymerase, eukaryota [Tanacetum cinerariifolium]
VSALVLDETCIKEFDFGMSLMEKVLFKFDSLASKEKFLNHSGIGSWFTELIQATSSFENDERIVWIFIEGLPIKAWTPNTFRKIASLWGEQKVIIQGKVYWIRVKELDAWFLNFQEDDKDDLSWMGNHNKDYLRTFIDRWESDTVIMGDFNEVRSEHERFGSTFNKHGAIAFNNFISSACLVDLPLEGLKINLHKSKLMGIGVSSNVVAVAVSLIGCFILTTPFNYLNVKVGSNMSRITLWDDVISKVSLRLSKWKLKLLSIGGRLSHLKSVLTSIPLYHMSIFKVSIGVLNHLEYIRQNFFYGADGSDRKLAWIGWNMVLTSKKNGGEVALKVLYKRLYALEMCKSISVAEKMGHPSLSYSFRRMPRDRWCWSLEGSQEFSVKSSRILINNTILPKAEIPTRWLRVVPIKVNVHACRVCLDKLPTRANLSLRGMDIPSIDCPLCNLVVESSSRIFSLVPWLFKIGEKI